MGQLTVRNVDDQVIRALKQRAAAHGHSAEAEHREILRQALLGEGRGGDDYVERARKSRERLRSDVDSALLIRADRDRDHDPDA